MIATSNCNAAKDLVSLFANGERVTALSFPDQVRRLRLKVASQPNHLDEVCRAFRSSSTN